LFIKKICIISDENLRDILYYDNTLKFGYITDLAYLSHLPLEQKIRVYNTVKDWEEQKTAAKFMNQLKNAMIIVVRIIKSYFFLVGIYFIWIVIFFAFTNKVLTIWSWFIMLHIAISLPLRFELKLKLGQFLSIPAIIINILLHYITNLNYDLAGCQASLNSNCYRWTGFYYYKDSNDRFWFLLVSIIH
jgi:hypothetical protein